MREQAKVTLDHSSISDDDNYVGRPVSSKSKWEDVRWFLDIYAKGRSKGNKLINWAKKLPDGSLLTNPQHSFLLDVCKRFIWSLHSDPPASKKRLDVATLPSVACSLIILVRWMLSNGYVRFSQLDEHAISRYILHCRNRPGKKGKTLTPGSLHRYLVLVDLLYAQRNKLPDAIKVHPFGGELASEAVGDLSAGRGVIPRIPDELAINIINNSLIWIEEYAEDILAACELRNKTYAKAIAKGVTKGRASKLALDATREFTPSTSFPADPKYRDLFLSYYGLAKALDFLTIACFICIAGLVGMRLSEILSLEVGCIETERANDGLIELTYLCGKTYKTEPEAIGRETRWVAPPPVKTAIRILEKLTLPSREKSKLTNLFLTYTGRQGKYLIDTISSTAINTEINQFAKFVDVPLYNGKVWRFSSHQFRKTFARFVGKQDKTGLHALSQHFKHVSQTMTDSYVGKDFELSELIEESRGEEMVQALDSILAADSLAGKMGDEILTRNYRFRGRAGAEVRKDYINFILSEADLTIVSHEFALCVFQPEVALCGGDKAKMGREVCVKCSNFVVSEVHRPYWEGQRVRNQEILDRLENHPPLIQGPIRTEIEQADRILLQLDGCKDKRSEQVEASNLGDEQPI